MLEEVFLLTVVGDWGPLSPSKQHGSKIGTPSRSLKLQKVSFN